jgi:hypothetical protein
MTAGSAASAPDDPRVKLRQLLRDYGQRCEIQLIASGTWEAVSRPSPGQTVVHCAHSLDELRDKIESDLRR